VLGCAPRRPACLAIIMPRLSAVIQRTGQTSGQTTFEVRPAVISDDGVMRLGQGVERPLSAFELLQRRLGGSYDSVAMLPLPRVTAGMFSASAASLQRDLQAFLQSCLRDPAVQGDAVMRIFLGLPPRQPEPEPEPEPRGRLPPDALHQACSKGSADLDLVEQLVRARCDVNGVVPVGSGLHAAPLHLAALNSRHGT
jgi:hypothetical protein